MPSPGKYIRTPKHRENARKKMLCVKRTEKTKKKMSSTAKEIGVGKWMKGRKLSKEHCKAISNGHTGMKYSKEHCEAISRGQIGLKVGDKNPSWQGGKTEKNQSIRNSRKYKQWREKIFERDNWTCQICNKRGGTLNADHIKSFAKYPKLRFNIDNGRTLCISCHKKTDNYGWKAGCK
jgi:HNH endonuclease